MWGVTGTEGDTPLALATVRRLGAVGKGRPVGGEMASSGGGMGGTSWRAGVRASPGCDTWPTS